jgi:hypothetical protein
MFILILWNKILKNFKIVKKIRKKVKIQIRIKKKIKKRKRIKKMVYLTMKIAYINQKDHLKNLNNLISAKISMIDKCRIFKKFLHKDLTLKYLILMIVSSHMIYNNIVKLRKV